MVAGVGHVRRPAHHNLVVRSECVFHCKLDVWKRTVKAIEEGHEIARAVNHLTRLVLSHANRVLIHQIVNGLNAPFIPNFFEPTPHENNIFVYGHVTPSFESTGELDALQASYSIKVRYEPALLDFAYLARHDSQMTSGLSQLELVQRLKEILVLDATGEKTDNREEYKNVRREVLADSFLKSRLPKFVGECSDLGGVLGCN